eukprot:Skav206262  [mRNA]  locus=scaffold265:166705:169001:- [translate_table: standard]
MATVPLERILCPVPAFAFSAVADVLRDVAVHLAGPILEQVLNTDFQLNLRLKDVENVIWKVTQYLPCLARAGASLGHLPFSLKRYQDLCPEAVTVSLPCRQTHCQCGKAVMQKAASASATVPNNLPGRQEDMDNHFLIFTQAAGVQRAEFCEKFCSTCRIYFVGGWQFEKKAQAYHHMQNLKYIGSDMDAEIFVSCPHLLCPWVVVPKYRSYFAVEVGLLKSLTDEIVHSGATFSSAVLRWVKQHPEREQVKRLLGPDLTLLERCRRRLEEAWYLWHATRMGGAALGGITWRLTQEWVCFSVGVSHRQQ